jgi:hypothetical protein
MGKNNKGTAMTRKAERDKLIRDLAKEGARAAEKHANGKKK